ncbi:cation:proton antiporter [Bdellovibrio sp. HCB-162]|uniref:cation:proton antiporter n=1 Tax=Bdellovibrio sp. HCB-162 TaxID=3394234 RepID=UPI0039BC2662
MKFVAWIVLGIFLGPSLFNLNMPSWFSLVSQAAGGVFLFFAGWEMRFLNLKKDARFYALVFIGSFIIPCVLGYFLLGQKMFLALAMGISALPVAIQLLKEKGLYGTLLAKRTITLASLCDICPWLILIFLLPQQDVKAWIISHWVVLAFFVGLVIGRFKTLQTTSGLLHFQMWVLAPVFFVGLGWKVDIVNLFSLPVFLSLLAVAIVTKSLGTYIFSRWAGESHQGAMDLSILLNARGAMEVLAAHFAYRAGLIDGASFAGLVLVGIITSLMAVPLVRKTKAPHLESIDNCAEHC